MTMSKMTKTVWGKRPRHSRHRGWKRVWDVLGMIHKGLGFLSKKTASLNQREKRKGYAGGRLLQELRGIGQSDGHFTGVCNQHGLIDYHEQWMVFKIFITVFDYGFPSLTAWGHQARWDRSPLVNRWSPMPFLPQGTALAQGVISIFVVLYRC